MNIIITGPKHCGKSTVIAKTLELLDGKISGFITEFPRRDAPDRELVLRSIDGGKSRNAAVWQDGRPILDLDVFNVFAPSLIELDSHCVVIDELGKFEKVCSGLKAAVENAFDASVPVLASVRLDAAGWMQELKSREDVTVFNVDETDRDALPHRLCEMLLSGK